MREQEKKEPLQTAYFRYWPKPRLVDGIRRPQFLKKSFIEQVINLVYHSCNRRELLIDPPLEQINGDDVQELHVQYSGSQDYPINVHVKLNTDWQEGAWREYNVKVTANSNAIELALNALEGSPSQIKDAGRLLQEPQAGIEQKLDYRPGTKRRSQFRLAFD